MSYLSFILLLLQLLCFIPYHVNSINVLVLGDSLDRFANEYYCLNYHGKLPTPWTDDRLKSASNPGGITCNDGKNSRMSTMMIFGANKTGPYYTDKSLRLCNCAVDTIDRIRIALETYFATFQSKPDLIMLHTSEWDVQHWVADNMGVELFIDPNAEFYRANNKTLEILKQQTSDRLDDIQRFVNELCQKYSCASPSHLSNNNNSTADTFVNLALRSDVYWPLQNPYHSPYPQKPGESVAFLNLYKSCNTLHSLPNAQPPVYANRIKLLLADVRIVLQQLVKERDFSFFDYNDDVWSVFNFDYSQAPSIFHDNLHPNWRFGSGYILKLLGLRYSRHLEVSSSFQKTLPPLIVDRDPQTHHAYTPGQPIRRILAVEAPQGQGGSNQQYGSGNVRHLYFVSYNLINFNSTIDNHHSNNNKFQLHLYRHQFTDFALLRMFSLGPGDIYTPTSMSEWSHFKPGDPLPSWMSVDNLKNNSYLVHCVDMIFQSHYGVEWWLLENMERRPLPYPIHDPNKTAKYLNAILLKDYEVKWDFVEIFGLAIVMPNIFQEYSVYRMEREKTLYVNINSTRHMIANNNPDAMFAKYGWKMLAPIEVLDTARIWDMRRIQEGEPLL